MTEDIQVQLAAAAGMDEWDGTGYSRQGGPEGVTFYAVTDDPQLAAQVGPLLAEKLDPTRRWGQVLHVELVDLPPGSQVHEVVVQDLGPVR